MLEFMARGATVGRPLATTPGVPAERVAALRAAFAATLEDADFIAQAAKEHMQIRAMTGEKLAELVAGMLNTPADVRERLKAALQPTDESTLAGAPGKR
jgi:tripartite-type tricarboxylate transporter receptor subunit TctC